jgi:putative ATPase
LKSISQKTLRGVNDKSMHYDLISAFIKSIRGSDLDASLYYLAMLLESGEDIDFIARRLIILSSEDIGNANPNALNIAVNCYNAIKYIGLPEASIILSQTVIYLASSPKSNSALKAINKATWIIKNEQTLEIPYYLKDNHNKQTDYKNPHHFGGYVEQKYLQEDKNIVQLSDIGFEKRLKEWLEMVKK